jgi:hypothetical protein
MDDIQPQTTKPISDDQELAKVLAGVSQESNNLDFEEAPAATAPAESDNKITPEALQPPVPDLPSIVPPNANTDDLNSIKKDAIAELRPLVDKLDLEPEEKFDTYLLLLRSTDDKELIAPAHIAAQNIADESRRAQALLDIIKEIDYLSPPVQPTI